MTRTISVCLLAVCSACGSSKGSNTVDGGGGGGGGDGGGGAMIDAPVNVPTTITISGTVTEKGAASSAMVTDGTIVAKKASDDSMVATGMTDGSGNFTLTVTTNGQALDGYLDVTDAADVETFVYPPAPLSADYAGVPVQMITQATIGDLPILTGATQSASDGMIGLEITTAAGAKVSGATVTTTPAGSVFYDSNGGLPTTNAKQKTTNTDGVAFVLNVAAGSVTVMATETGDTFKSHTLKARAGALAETIVTE